MPTTHPASQTTDITVRAHHRLTRIPKRIPYEPSHAFSNFTRIYRLLRQGLQLNPDDIGKYALALLKTTQQGETFYFLTPDHQNAYVHGQPQAQTVAAAFALYPTPQAARQVVEEACLEGDWLILQLHESGRAHAFEYLEPVHLPKERNWATYKEEVREYAARRAYLLPNEWLTLAQDDSERVREEIARQVQPEQQAAFNLLLADPSVEVRRALAWRDDLPYSALAPLLNDPELDLRRNMAGRHDLPPEALEVLLHDPAPEVLDELARRSDLPLHAAQQLQRCPDEHVALSLFIHHGHHLSYPEGELQAYLTHPDKQARWAAQHHPDLPQPLRISPMLNPSTAARAAYAARKDTPLPDLMALLGDPSPTVKLAAYDTLGELHHLTTDITATLLESPHPEIRAAMLNRSPDGNREPRVRLTPDIIHMFAQETEFQPLFALVQHQGAPAFRHLIRPILQRSPWPHLSSFLLKGELTDTEWREIADSLDWESINRLVSRQETKPERVRWQKELKDARRGNPYGDHPTDISVQRQVELAQSEYPCVRAAMAARYRLAREAAELLMHDPNPYIRARVAINHSTPDDLTVQIADALLQTKELAGEARHLLIHKMPYTSEQLDYLLEHWTISDLAQSNLYRNNCLTYDEKRPAYGLTAEQAHKMFHRLQHHKAGREAFLSLAEIPEALWPELLRHPLSSIRQMALRRAPLHFLNLPELLETGNRAEVKAILKYQHSPQLKKLARKSKRELVQKVYRDVFWEDFPKQKASKKRLHQLGQEEPSSWAVTTPATCPMCGAATQQVMHANLSAYVQLSSTDEAHNLTAQLVPGYQLVQETGEWGSTCHECAAPLPQNWEAFYWPGEHLHVHAMNFTHAPVKLLLESPVTRHLQYGRVKNDHILPIEADDLGTPW